MDEQNGPASGIAIVGMAGRFPGAADLERFWENLAAGVESVTFFGREELLAAGVDPAQLDDPAYVPARAALDGAELFDAELFGYSPREAELMDPQHRLLLECAWEALEHAGCDPRRYPGLIGVYAGAGPASYLLFNLITNREALASMGQFQTLLGNGGDFLAPRLSYKLGLRGPSLTVQTACSTSLVAVHLAVQSLLNGECDLALAGGVRICVPRPAGYLYETDGVFSPDGHCRPFDAAAQGPVDGEGAAIVALKRLEDALADGNLIHAVILGTAVNNDGDDRVGFTAPGVSGQAAVLALAQAVAGVHPETIGFIEGHGTATPLGDPIEVAALRQVFAASTSRKGFCALGSVKGNVGHLDAAAGAASLIKAALALERAVIPPTPHFERPNPRLELEDSPFFVNAGPIPWPAGPEPRRAGVSSFGQGGTNAHVVLEEAPPLPPGTPSRPWQLLVLSAAGAPALEAMTDRLADHLARHPDLDLADVAFTLQVGRRELAHRRMLVCRSVAEAREALASRDPQRVFSGVVEEDPSEPLASLASFESLRSLGQRWLAGAEVDWHALHAGERRLRVPLPAYPFQRKRHWIGALASAPVAARPAAPAPRQPRPALDTPYEAPRGDLQQRLACLFEDLLGIAPVGAADNFFALGGHSLLGLQLLSRIKSEMGTEVRLEWLFQAASVAELAEVIAVVEEETRASFAANAADIIPRVPRDRDLPLSYAQERLWFLDRLEPGTPAFNLTESVRITGVLDVPALGRALAEIVRRHESLRTAFVDLQGHPVQRILPAVDVPLPLVDLSGLPEERREAEAGRLAVRAGERRFDLSRPPLLAAELVRLARDHHAMVLVYHHIIGDGWSSAVLLSDLTQIYRAFAAAEPSPLPELPVQYADFASWQRARLGDEEMAEQLAGWRERLAPPLPVLDLPTDRPRPAVQSFRGMSEVLIVPPEVADGVRGLGAAQGATPFMVLLSAFAVVLSRWSGQEDLIVGSPVAGRDRLELERMIGIFLNMLPLRLDLSGDPAYRGLLGRTREASLAAYTRKEVPVERILEEVQPGRDLARSPLFQVLFNFLAFPHPSLDVPGLAIETFPIREMPSRFDFTVYAEEIRTGEISLDLVYNADLFDRATMTGFLAQLGRVLERAAAEPDTPVSRISLLTPEAVAILPDPRAPLAAGDWTGAVHERFAERARLDPDRPAIVDVDGTWTYGELAARAGRLALQLRSAGVRRGDLVAIYAWRGAPLVEALLGVLQAGAAFLVLDPAHPAPRLRSAVRQARPQAWIEIAAAGPVPDELAAALPETRIRLEDSAVGTALVPAAAQPDDLAYVAFTSGSTGEPRGVLGTHGPLAHFCAWHAATFGVGEDDRFSLLSGLSHDPLLRDVFTPLALGATLCIPGPDDLGSPARWMVRQRITVCHLTPALGQVLADGGTELPDLRRAFFGGDALTERDVARLRERAPRAACVNFYGTTETPQAMAWHDASGAGDWPARRVPVGRGIDGAQLLVVNGAGDLAAPGELGEVWVRTPHLSVGYLGDERLTAERYAANPFTGDPSDRIYRTGDLGRYRSDGSVDLAGRRDRQIQVRGFRVEPAEVEAALALHPAVREAAVLHRGVLTAWLAGPRDASRPGPAEMRDFVRRLLPDPMVPEAFVWLERLPLTPNGKLDRAALPEPEPVPIAAGAPGAKTAPRTPLETSLAAIWREVLGIEELGLEDNFFELGGHSLLATQVTSRVCEAFGVDLPLRALFEAPTLSGLTGRIEALREPRETGRPELPPLRRVPRNRDLPLSFAQERLWFLAQLAPESPAYNMPFAVRLTGALDRAALAAALSEIRRRHETLRTAFRLGAAGRPAQVIHPAERLALPLLDLSGLPEASRPAEARRVAGGLALAPFDLARGPLVRALLFRLAPDEHVIQWVTHHVAADAWSLVAVFLPELAALYRAFSQGLPSPLPELPVQYADFAVWQRSWLRGELLEEQLGYWRRALAGASTLELPVDRPRRPVPSARGATRSWSLPAAQTARLRDLARAQGATLFMAVHAGLAALLQRYTGQDDVAVGMPVANRTRGEIEGLIGFFVNTLVLRVDLSGEPDLPGALALSREAALGAFAHQDLPFERLVEELELGWPRDPHRPPLLRVLFQHQNAPGGELELPGLTLAPFPLGSATSRFELVVNLFEGPGGLRAVLTYDADLFESATIARLCEHFGTLLAAWAVDPGRPASDLPLLSAAERHQLVVEPSDGLAAERERRCPHRRFEEQVDRAPDAPAVSMGSERLTYRELDERANRLAHDLLARGVRPGDRVALALERSVGLVVAILAVLKTGAAYVPLDPADPSERRAFALEDSGASLLIDADAAETARRSGERPAVAADPALPAYVIYTSGSTGRPKGVVVSHASVDRLLTATAPWFGFGPADVWTLFHSYTFDFSVWEMWGALLHGGRLVIVPYWESRSPEDFYRLLVEEQVTVLNQTPSAFRQLLWAEEAVLGGAPPGFTRRWALRWVVLGGEALDLASLAPWFDRHGDERPTLVNMYGITETTVHVTFRPVRRDDLDRGSVLGRPIPDLRVHVLDRHLRPQPIGVPGEIHVGGAGLALGYLGRPDLTAERFVADPFSGEPGARLYRSGDLARRLPDGDLEYLARIDHQVKIRGFRIELGEIEAALASHPAVRESVVLAREDGSGRRLVAYAVPAPDQEPDPADLRAFLAGRLPDFMVPSALVLLSELPLTANGKVDRRALPPPAEAAAASRREHVAPRTDLERFLAGQIREVLGLAAEPEIGVHDDFFELGGSSITGAILIHRLQDALREIVHVVAIFDHPTVASLAGYVREQHRAAAWRIWGEGEAGAEAAPVAAVGPAEVEEMRRLIATAREPVPEMQEPLNPPALFVLSPPRSGSTLLRVMLGVHPGLFAPPELELLSFRTLAERSAAFQGRDAFWREGLVRAVMEARQVGAAEAERVIADGERQGWTARRFYRELQGWLGARMLVDKTPSYALDPEALRRAEAGFARARYLHLVRHPQATIRSFEEARLDQVFFRRPHPFSRRQLAELVWTVSHRNILDFLAGVPRERWMRVRFEELVREPQRVLQEVCGFLGVEHRPEMAEPYREGAARMVDGPHAVSRMLGDVKLLAHGRVDPAAAERWQEAGEIPLGAPAWDLAAELGYGEAAPERGVLVPIQAGSPDRPPLFCVHPVGGEVVAYRELARRLPGQTVYGLQSPARSVADLREMAALYVEAVRQAQTEGPYRLAGWSLGGAVAFEMARQLAERGQQVELLALIDTASPVLWMQEPEPDEAGLVAAFALDLARLSGAPVPEVDLSGLDGDGALARVLRLGQEAGVLAPGVELSDLRRLFERFRANRRAMSSYEPVPYAGEAVLFRARERPAGRQEDPDLGWRGLVAGLSVQEVPGDHYSILREHVEVVAEPLRDLLSPGGRIPRLPRDGRRFPASASQLREWLLDRLQPGTGAYNIPGGGKVVGPADLAVLERCIQEIVRRHETLRTTFEAGAEGEPVQVVAPELRIPVPRVDLSALPDGPREAEARWVSASEWNAPFDLERGPLVRVTVARLAGREHLLLATLHHIVADGWSMTIFYRELAALYEAFATGRPSPLPELPVQYADYAAWQRRRLAGEGFEKQVGYWRRQLAGVAPLELPTDRPRPPVQRFAGARHPFRLPPEPAAGLRETAQRQGASLFMALFAAFSALLGRYSGQDDFAVGTYSGHRDHAELEDLIGFFINSLVLRPSLEGDPGFRQLLDRAREVTLEAFAHQDVPFEKLLEALRVERDLSRTPLFQVMLVLHNFPRAAVDLAGVRLETIPVDQGHADFDLTLWLSEDSGGLGGAFTYSVALFEEATIARLGGHLAALIRAALAEPDRSVHELPLLGEDERRQILGEWSRGPAAAGTERCLHELFEEQARRTPAAIALEGNGEAITYAELNRRADRLAAHLRGLGVAPETLVGLRVERSPEMIVALLAVLKAGGAYLPLDPAYPEARLAWMIEDSRAVVVDVSSLASASLPSSLDSPWAANAAYVIYTSGSTGRPKGVVVEHRAIAGYTAGAAAAFGLRPGDRVLQFASMSFDTSAEEIYPALSSGATLVLRPDDMASSIAHFLREVERLRLTVLDLPTAFWHELAEGLGREGSLPASVRLVVVGGERALPDRLALWRGKVGPGVRLLNTYGPTEATIVATCCDLTGGPVEAPIGRPVPGARAYVLDRRGGPAPVGVPGELHLGGSGLARGYLNRPEITAERFVPDPFGGAPGGRLYRTGDLARWRPAGELEFLGRVDHQIKIRGFRVELGEIEATLRAHDGVRDVAVTLHRTPQGDPRLVAYLVWEGEPAEGAALRSFLLARLPEYMVPVLYIDLPALPLTPSGKVDRRSLPEPRGERPDAGAGYVAPRTELERTIAAMWRDLLGIDRVGREDNLFDLGAHSLLIVRAHGRLREALGRELTVIDLFRNPSVGALARHLASEEDLPSFEQVESLARRQKTAEEAREQVAIIGMAGRFPGARDLDELWRNLRDGVDSVRDLTEEELLASGVDPALVRSPDYVRAAAPIADVERFDASFFDFSPREAELLDPQSRVFLECAWEALESAGYVSESYNGWIGLFAGVSLPAYLMSNLIPHPEIAAQVGNFQLMLANDRDYFTTRISYKLGLQGPSVNVQTACSTSLVAVHLACQSLLSHQCSLALAGGVRINFPQLAGYRYQEGSIFSPDGRCRAFDAGGRGALFGEGAGIVVLKRLSEALADGDTIHAVIRGSACNNDGLDKVGYTAPSVNGQAKVIALAQVVAGVSPDTVSYVEAHGSGTPLGDPIEVAALSRAFRAHTERKRFCALGSIKTNVGHLEAAAGIAGLLKTVLALKHRTLPPSLHFETPNPEIDFDNGPFYVNTAAREWICDGAPRLAGVSSFGMGGTNAHAVLEEAPETEPGSASRPWQLLLLSARTPTSLEASAGRLAAFLREHPEIDFADAVHTLQVGRRAFGHRLALVCLDREDALAAFESADPRRLLRSEQESADRPVTFLFPGLGEHYPGMALGLYRGEPAFRAALDECCDLLAPHLGLDLRRLLFPEGLSETGAGVDMKALFGRSGRAAGELDRTRYAQPAIFAVEYALANLLMEWGIRPQSLIGYSLGEYVAACLAGVLSLPAALALVAQRARLIDGLPAGAMLAVPLPEAEARALLGEELSVAALNGPSVTVASGPEAAIADLERRLAGRGLAVRRLPTTHAFHSRMMEPIRGAFADLVARAPLARPRIPYLSNVTGTWITAQEATEPGYWVRHLCQAVRFADGLAELSREPERVLVEVGPGQGLTALALQSAAGLVAVPTLRSSWDRQPDTAFLLTTLAKLWLTGLRVDWAGFHAHERRLRVPLPTYPFERQRCFIDPPRTAVPRAEAAETAAAAPRTAARHARPAHLRNAYAPPATDLERRLAPIWQEVLGIAEIGIHDSFFELGGHSLLAPQLLVRLRKDLGIDLAMRDFVETPTVARMAEAIELIQREGAAALAARREEVDLWAEASFLDPAIAPATPWTGGSGEPAGIFLTGGTGFLGSHVFAELLRRTHARVHCLVRAADAEEAFGRLRAALEERELWRDDMASRIAAVPGDLAEPRFGLAEEAFRELADQVDLIYHCGAWVNFNYPYKTLAPANVHGTVEALRLAALGRARPLHFISSIAATPEGDYGFRAHPVVYEDEDSDSIEGLFGGYGETKWVCERLIRIARSRGLPVTIYRPGVLSGHSRTGIGNPRDMVWSLIKSCIQMGVHPLDDYRLDVTPVDYVASAVVHLSLEPGNANRLFQLPHPSPPNYRQVYEMVRAHGYPLEPLPFREWIDRVVEVARVDSGNALSAFIGVAENYDRLAERATAEGEDGRLKDIIFDGTNTRNGLAGSGIVCPELDEELIARYLDSFVRTGFYPPPPPAGPSRPWQALVLSAGSEADLERATAGLADFLGNHRETDLGDLAYTLQVGRRLFHHRRMLVCRDVEDAISALKGSAAGRLETFAASGREQQVSFLLPGVGDHYPDMALGLYRSEPAFRRVVDDCCDRLLPELGFDLRDELFPGLANGGADRPVPKRDVRRLVRGEGDGTGSRRMARMTAAHPAVFVVEYALAQLLMGWGIRPRAMIGYSLGEYTAACLAGVLSLEDGLTLVARRARLMEKLPAGAMLAVPLPLAEIEPLLRDGLGVAVANGPALHVLSGSVAAVEALEAELARRGVLCRRLLADQAAHSPMMEPIAGRLRDLLAGIELRPPRIPYVSNVTGTWIRPEEATDPDYWVRHLCGRVLFGDGLARLLETESVLLEVGPGQSLSAFAKQYPAGAAGAAGGSGRASLTFSMLRSAYNPQPDRAFLLGTLGRLWMAGVPVDWAATHAGRRRRISAALETSPAGHRGRVHVWPNGMRIVAQSQTEAEHFYHDIFEKEIYRRHGIALRDGACIFDVGANIGAFMLYAHQACRGAQIHSFEPAPPLFEKLRLNAALNRVRARLFDFGLSDRAGTAAFTFYPRSSGMSSFHADKEQEKDILRRMMEKEREAGVAGVGELMGCADTFLEERFRSESFECRLRTLSEVIEECEVEWIDLLKIDVQKAELAVLEGIREEHWPRIGQIVMEVHDLDGRLERIVYRLRERGFRVAVEQDELLQGSVLWNLFAVREGAEPPESARERQRRAFQRSISPAAPGRERPVFGVPYVAAGSELERSLAEIWQRVLGIEEVGIDDNFFDLGGTSLLGLQIVNEIKSRLGAELSPVAIFEAPTVRTLAQSLCSEVTVAS